MMSRLSENWAYCKLEDVVTSRGEKVSPTQFPDNVFLGMDHVEAHSMRIIGGVLAKEMKSNCSRFYESDVIYGRLRPYLNKVTIPGFAGLASAEFIVFPPSLAITPKFLLYRLNARDFVSFASHLNEGDRPRVSFNQISEFDLNLPPLVEQRAIVAKIESLFSELDQGVEQLQTVRQQLKRYRQSVLKAAFEGKLTAAWRQDQQTAGTLPTAQDLLTQIKTERENRYQQQLADWQQAVKDWEAAGSKGKKPRKPGKLKASPHLADEDLPNLSNGWAWVNLGSLISSGPQNGLYMPKSAYGSGTPIVRINDFQDNWLRPAKDILRLNASSEEIDLYKIVKDDVIVNRVNSMTHLGKCLLVPESYSGMLFESNMMRLHLLDSVNVTFVVSYLKSRSGKTRLISNAKWAVNQASINQGDVESTIIPIASKDEQEQIIQEIESRFSVLDELEKAVELGLKQAKSLRQSILKKAFEGRLLSEAELTAVREDPAYEPAETLLERIRAEREPVAVQAKVAKPARALKLPKGERFRQAACAAYVVQRLWQRPTFGRVQLMKLMYLIPHVLAQASHVYARRQAAGPLDPALYKVEGLAKKQGWFTARKSGQHVVYRPGEKIKAACRLVRERFGDKTERVDWLLDEFAKMDTERAELLATTFAVWNDLLIDQERATQAKIVQGVHGWHPSKAEKFPAARIRLCINWMKENDLVPSGIGPRTEMT